MAEVTGYTVTAGSQYENLYTLTSGPLSPEAEPLLWQIADLMKADLESRNAAETYIGRVTRHERGDVALTPPT